MNLYIHCRALLSVLLLALGLGITGCSGSDAETTEQNTGDVQTGRFILGQVAGLTYTTESLSGVTDAEGRYSYRSGETVTFSLGDLTLPSIVASGLVSPMDIFQQQSIYQTEVVNFSRLLLSLDQDGDLDNGVFISEQTLALLPATLSFDAARFDTSVSQVIANSEQMRTSLVTADVTLDYLRQSMQANALAHDGCSMDHPSVGKSADFVTLFHDVSGTLTVIDDCTLEITEFNYDGEGPLVYFYAALEQQYSSPDAFVIGPLLTGTEYRNDQVLLKLPEGKTLDDINGLSVWCIDFAVNFGDAYLGND